MHLSVIYIFSFSKTCLRLLDFPSSGDVLAPGDGHHRCGGDFCPGSQHHQVWSTILTVAGSSASDPQCQLPVRTRLALIYLGGCIWTTFTHCPGQLETIVYTVHCTVDHFFFSYSLVGRGIWRLHFHSCTHHQRGSVTPGLPSLFVVRKLMLTPCCLHTDRLHPRPAANHVAHRRLSDPP